MSVVQISKDQLDKMKKEILSAVPNKCSKKELEKVLNKVLNTDDLNVSKNNKPNNKSNKSNKKSSKKTKRKLNPYMTWLTSPKGMKVIKDENDGKTQTELFKIAGKKWRSMSDEDKKQFNM
jgi:ethanolamine utilization protein EutQ (cupin superfamily)